MKKILITGLVLFGYLLANVRFDISNIEQNCLVITTGLLNNKLTFDIDFREKKIFGYDIRFKTGARKLKNCDTVIDTLTYMDMPAGIAFTHHIK